MMNAIDRLSALHARPRYAGKDTSSTSTIGSEPSALPRNSRSVEGLPIGLMYWSHSSLVPSGDQSQSEADRGVGTSIGDPVPSPATAVSGGGYVSVPSIAVTMNPVGSAPIGGVCRGWGAWSPWRGSAYQAIATAAAATTTATTIAATRWREARRAPCTITS